MPTGPLRSFELEVLRVGDERRVDERAPGDVGEVTVERAGLGMSEDDVGVHGRYSRSVFAAASWSMRRA